MRTRSLLTHVGVVVLAVTTLVLVSMGLYEYRENSARLHNELSQSLDRIASRLTVAVLTPLYNLDFESVDGALQAEMQDTSVAAVLIREPASEGIVRGMGRATDGTVEVVTEYHPPRGVMTRFVDLSRGRLALGRLEVYLDTRERDARLRAFLVGNLFRVLLIDLILVGAMIVTLRSAFIRPVLALTAYSQQIAEGDLDQRLEVVHRHELGELAVNLDRMRRSIREKISGLEREIEQRLDAETALREREENLRITLDSIGDAVIATDADGYIAGVNPVAEVLLGLPEQEALGRKPTELLTMVEPDTRTPVPDPVRMVLDGGLDTGGGRITAVLSAGGDEHLMVVSRSPIIDDRGEIRGVVLVLRDVTENQRLEQQLAQAQKMDSIGRLAGGVAHDFNNMLAGILGAAEMLRARPDRDERDLRFLKMITDAAERAADLTRKLLVFSRKGWVEQRPVDICGVIRDAVAILERSIDPRVSLEYRCHLPRSLHVLGDSTLLQNVVLNLGVNARDAMPEGGKITITANLTEFTAHRCNGSSFDLSPGMFVEIEVGDTGSGMSAEVLSHIFEPFYTSKETGKGTGLGLAAVYGTIQGHRGEITVDSVVGEGTVFRLWLPLHEGVAEPGEKSDRRVIPGHGRVLLVDDEEMVREVVSAQLHSLGYDVVAAADGAAAVALYREQGREIDVVVLDMVMPKMNGRDCFRRIREIDPEAKILISSGFTRDLAVDGLLAEGGSDFLQKPYTQAAFSGKLRNLLSS